MDLATKLTLVMGALTAAALVVHLKLGAPGTTSGTERSTVIERAQSGMAGEGERTVAPAAGTSQNSDSPRDERREERIVPPVKRVAPKTPELPPKPADKGSSSSSKGAAPASK